MLIHDSGGKGIGTEAKISLKTNWNSSSGSS